VLENREERISSLQFLFVKNREDGMTTDRAGLASHATGMAGVEMATWIEHRFLCGVVANQTLLLFRVLVDLDFRWRLLG